MIIILLIIKKFVKNKIKRLYIVVIYLANI